MFRYVSQSQKVCGFEALMSLEHRRMVPRNWMIRDYWIVRLS